jgi:formylglycine-generating enzyme required for sulfatase activity
MLQLFLRLLAGICGTLFYLQGAAGLAEARRVALVIGNADYKVGPLANPVNDAVAVAEAFGKLGFDKVVLERNLGAEAFRAALLEMSRESARAELGVVYFAGHGMEVAGKNFLIPVDARLAKAGDLSLEAITLDSVLEQLAGVTRLKLVILDACRDNPFLLAGAKRNTKRGLHRIEPEDNTLVVYAARDGTTAEDGAGRRHSPFTEALLRHIATPGLEIGFVFRRVRDDVVAATKLVQYPHVYGTLGGKEFYLKPQVATPAGATPAPPAAPSRAEVAQFCHAMAANPSLAAVRSLRDTYRGTPMAPCIEARIGELQKLALAAPPAATPQPPLSVAAAPLTPGEERALKRGESFRECEVCPEMVVVPAGSFMMGSPAKEADRKRDEGPQRKVTIARPFAVGKFEVTFAEWDACVSAGGCGHRPNDLGWGRGRRPVIDVSWNDITATYLSWLVRTTGKTYRLLTEAEWEHAARAGTTTPFATGQTITTSKANFDGNHTYGGSVKGEFRGRTIEVGSFLANAFGLHDMHGNVWEWVQDCHRGDYASAPVDGSAVATGECDPRVLRGGSWGNVPRALRSAFRNSDPPTHRSQYLGFRVARSLAP